MSKHQPNDNMSEKEASIYRNFKTPPHLKPIADKIEKDRRAYIELCTGFFTAFTDESIQDHRFDFTNSAMDEYLLKRLKQERPLPENGEPCPVCKTNHLVRKGQP